ERSALPRLEFDHVSDEEGRNALGMNGDEARRVTHETDVPADVRTGGRRRREDPHNVVDEGALEEFGVKELAGPARDELRAKLAGAVVGVPFLLSPNRFAVSL